MQTKSIGMGMLVIICNISIPATGCNKAGGSDSQAIVATYCKKKEGIPEVTCNKLPNTSRIPKNKTNIVYLKTVFLFFT